VVVDGATYRIYRQTLLGAFVMEAPNGEIVRSAVKPSMLRRRFVVSDDRESYVLQATTAFRRECALFHNERYIGSIVPDSWLTRRAKVQFTEDVPLPLQAFLIWLMLLLWKRDSDAAAGG
jgi:hypothetical protein